MINFANIEYPLLNQILTSLDATWLRISLPECVGLECFVKLEAELYRWSGSNIIMEWAKLVNVIQSGKLWHDLVCHQYITFSWFICKFIEVFVEPFNSLHSINRGAYVVSSWCSIMFCRVKVIVVYLIIESSKHLEWPREYIIKEPWPWPLTKKC